jgi:RNA polymerase sigma factor (sigma-70 family)
LTVAVTYQEQELVALLKAKNEPAFNYLYGNYSGALYNIVLQIIPDTQIASDVLQEAFVNIWKKIESYDAAKGRLFTWMLNVTRNMAIDMVRSKSYQNSQKNKEFPMAEQLETPGGAVVQPGLDNIGLKKAVYQLKPEQRVLVDLAYFKGYTHEEIAQMEQIPLGTVKTRIRNALTQLRQYLS